MNSVNDIGEIIHNLQKMKSPETNLPAYAARMGQTAHALSSVRFSMNFFVFFEKMTEDLSEGKPVPTVMIRLWNSFFEGLNADRKGEANESFDIKDIKERSTALMNKLVNLGGHIQLIEYAMNRMEYRYHNGSFPEGYSDEKFTELLLANIVGGEKKDSVQDEDYRQMQMVRCVEIVEQLPLRMTKMKFFQLLSDGMSVYNTSEKNAIDNLMESIGIAAGFSEVSDTDTDFPFISGEINHLYEAINRAAEKKEPLNKDEFEELWETLKLLSEELQNCVDLMMLLQELINDIYVLHITKSSAGHAGTCLFDALSEDGRKTAQSVSDIVNCICDLIEERKDLTALSSEEIERVEQMYPELEGSQEILYAQMNLFDSSFDEIYELPFTKAADSDPSWKILLSDLRKVKLLLSTSLYVALEEKEEDTESFDPALYVASCYETAAKKISEKLSSTNDRLMKKAIMAKVIALLPPFLRSYDALENYILTSLSGCENEAEKIASIEIILGLIKDEEDENES